MTVRVILAACRLQLAESRRRPAQLLILVTSPLFAAMFLSITTNSHNRGAVTNAIFAPALISLWFLSLDLGGSTLNRERWQQTLGQLIGTPSRLSTIVSGRILAVAAIGALTFIEAYLVARLGFGIDVRIPHGWLIAATIAVTLFAMVGTATALAGLFVLSRQVLLFQNAMTYPFYILGGVLVPVGILPVWVQPISRIFFLSWSSDLIRACLRPEAVANWGWRLAVIGLLGAVALIGGVFMTEGVVTRLRVTGRAGQA